MTKAPVYTDDMITWAPNGKGMVSASKLKALQDPFYMEAHGVMGFEVDLTEIDEIRFFAMTDKTYDQQGEIHDWTFSDRKGKQVVVFNW